MLVQGGFHLRATRVLRKNVTRERRENAPRNPQAVFTTFPIGERMINTVFS